jgi:hypothetical protein
MLVHFGPLSLMTKWLIALLARLSHNSLSSELQLLFGVPELELRGPSAPMKHFMRQNSSSAHKVKLFL